MKSIRLLFIIIFMWFSGTAQELNCTVQVAHQQIQTTNIQIFQSLESDIREFLNNHKWTPHVYSNNERIECNIMINLSEYNGTDKFVGTLQVQSRRPVYGSSYYTVMFNYKESDNNFTFDYSEQQPLEFNETSNSSNLTSVLAFYAYIILGIDYDSFSMEGGSEYFLKAQNIVYNAQSTSYIGWKAYESRKQDNRYFLIDGIVNKTFSPVRRSYYRYHRLGLDIMSEKQELGRAEIAECFKLIQKVFREKPNSLFVALFFTSKSDEILKIFSESQPDEKQRVIQILKEIDIVNASKYDKM